MKGYFKPRNPHKYKGDVSNIIYRSSWELKAMAYFDQHSSILKWASEELVIPYRSAVDGKIHRYFPDFWVKKIGRDGNKSIVVIEVKPYKETIEPKKQKKMTKTYLNEVKTWGVNTSKWNAAIEYCKTRGWDFRLMTEYELGLK